MARFVLRALVSTVVALGSMVGLTFLIGAYLAPLTWTTDLAIERERRRSSRAHERWGTRDAAIDVTHRRVVIAQHSLGGTELADLLEPAEHGRYEGVLDAIDLEPQSCVDYRIALSGSDWLGVTEAVILEDGVEVADGGGSFSTRPMQRLQLPSMVTGFAPNAATGSVAWCSPAGGRVRLVATFAPMGGPARPLEWIGGDHVAHVIAGRTEPGTLLWLTQPTEEGSARWRAHYDRVDRERAIGERVEITWGGGAVRLPASPPVYHALVAAAAFETGRRLNPRSVPAYPDDLPPGDPGDVYPSESVPDRSAPVVVHGERTWRVLAVVDRGALGAPCVEVALTASATRTRPPRVVALDVPAWTRRELEQSGNTSTDSACPARGIRLYLVTERDRGAYSLDVLRGEAPEGAVASASTFEGLIPFAEERHCAAGDVEACERAGLRVAHWPAYRARRAEGRQMLATACEAGRTRACAARALAERPPDVARLTELCQAGSDEAHGLVCMWLGDALRRERAERSVAMDAYRRACDAGLDDACHNLRAAYP